MSEEFENETRMIPCLVSSAVHRFYLGKSTFVSGGAVVELSELEAKTQAESGIVRIISPEDAKYIKSKLKGEKLEALHQLRENEQLRKRLNLLEKKNDATNEITLLRTQNAELQKQNTELVSKLDEILAKMDTKPKKEK
jgi:hypothetical protein